MVRHISHRIAVMYRGNIVEIGKSEDVYQNPSHPYTKGLLDSVLDPKPNKNRVRNSIDIGRHNPKPIDPENSCVFSQRCEECMEICRKQRPDMVDIGKGHRSACFLRNKSVEK